MIVKLFLEKKNKNYSSIEKCGESKIPLHILYIKSDLNACLWKLNIHCFKKL